MGAIDFDHFLNNRPTPDLPDERRADSTESVIETLYAKTSLKDKLKRNIVFCDLIRANDSNFVAVAFLRLTTTLLHANKK